MTCRQTLVVTGGSVIAVLHLYAKWLSTGHVVPPDIHGDERQHGRRPPINMQNVGWPNTQEEGCLASSRRWLYAWTRS
jgi:hypothetical protein